MDDDLIDRIETAFAAAILAHAVSTRLEVTSAHYRELARQYGVPAGLRMYRGKTVLLS
jgi:hypothetical protein